MDLLLYWVGLAAVAVNALTGVLDAGRKQMDLIGVVMVGSATALGVSPVVVQGDLRAGILVEVHRVAEISRRVYAITPSRRFPNPVVRELVAGAAEVSPPGAANPGSEAGSKP
jgi:hypothetical protein